MARGMALLRVPVFNGDGKKVLAKEGFGFFFFNIVAPLLTLFLSAHSLLCHDTVEAYLTRRLGFNGKL